MPLHNSIAAIDLADSKQMVVVSDHESRVLARADVPAAGLGAGCGAGLGRERATAAGSPA